MNEISYENGELILDGTTTIRQNSKDIIFLRGKKR